MRPTLHSLDERLLLGRYRVVRLLGEGGMGTVYLARVEGAEGFTRPVVVKRMKQDVRSTDEGNRLFIREAKILSKLQHPGVVGISDFGVEDGAHIMVLEYVHGYTLAPWLAFRQKRQLPLPVDICLFIVRRVLDALHYAHNFGTEVGQELEIVHRDVSPDNVLLSAKGYIHLLDFGVASMRGPLGLPSTASGAFRGKLCYAAPETVQGEAATPRSDQYSAAVVLLELLTGTTPFSADSVAETFVKMVNDAPPLPSSSRNDIPDGLDAALTRALSKQPGDRFDSALSFSRELRRLQHDDDDDVAEQLAAMVREDFEAMPEAVGVEPLKDRAAALDRIHSGPPALAAPPGASATDAATLVAIAAAAPVSGGAHAGRDAQSASPPSQLRGLLMGLLVVGGLIAVGLGAAVALLSRGGSATEPVVVVSGNAPPVTPMGQAPSAEPQGPAPEASVDSPETDTFADVGSTLQAAVPSGPPRRSAGVATPAPSDTQSRLTRSVQSQSGALQSCFTRHLSSDRAHQDAVLHFSVASQGGAAKVHVEPSSLAATELGRCLQSAARAVRFAPMSEAVSFKVPVRARISRNEVSP